MKLSSGFQVIELTTVQEKVYSKLIERGIDLFAPNKELRQAFAETVLPRACYRIAKELQELLTEGA